jgi:hypothetical protein
MDDSIDAHLIVQRHGTKILQCVEVRVAFASQCPRIGRQANTSVSSSGHIPFTERTSHGRVRQSKSTCNITAAAHCLETTISGVERKPGFHIECIVVTWVSVGNCNVAVVDPSDLDRWVVVVHELRDTLREVLN